MRSPFALAAVLFAACPGAPYDTSQHDPPPATPSPTAESPKGNAPRSTAEVRRDGNHLKGQPSPYLEQHAHNPVDWYPWGEEALALAKELQRPIFLSIGYSTCHWCHVMEKESFEDDEVAQFLNEHFVSIKVDREQRPEIDALYIKAVADMGGSTGWPLTVFLTPDLEPFFGGTYYPKVGGRGRPGFMDVLGQVDKMWRDEGEAVAKKGQQVLARIERRALAKVQSATDVTPAVLERAMAVLDRARDPVNGGFGRRNKFPNTPLLLASLRFVARTNDEKVKEHLILTLEQIAAGGIRDHLAGTFHRYAVDLRWHVPHFEKMLYDNAQLAGLYIEAGRTLERPDFIAVGRAVLDDLVANWQQDDGGFVVGFDADDPNGEGAYYSWTPAELEAQLGKENAQIFARAFDVDVVGDREIEGRSVLHRHPDAEVAESLGIEPARVPAVLSNSMPKLAAARKKRPPPAMDDKKLVAWNGLAIAALADAARWLDEPRYREAAEKAGTFVLDRCFADGKLARGFRGDTRIGDGFLDDYALAGIGLLRLHAATGDTRWLRGARDLATAIVERHYDEKAAAFMRTPPGVPGVPVRMADMDDGVIPSGGSAATLLAIELGAISGDEKLYEIGHRVLERSAAGAQSGPYSAGYVLVAVDHAAGRPREVVIAGDAADARTQALWAEVASTSHARILPVRIDAAGAGNTLSDFPALAGKKALREKPTAFVCERGSCQAPTSEPAKLRTQIANATR